MKIGTLFCFVPFMFVRLGGTYGAQFSALILYKQGAPLERLITFFDSVRCRLFVVYYQYLISSIGASS
jgi:hypothetical protein